MSKILSKMYARKDSEFFKEPVPWEAMGLFDYPNIIKQPMDLQTVKSKLDLNHYKRMEDVASDIRLTFINAMTYNAPGSRVYSHAKSLSEYWEQNWANINKADDVDKPPTTEEMTQWVEKCHRSFI